MSSHQAPAPAIDENQKAPSQPLDDGVADGAAGVPTPCLVALAPERINLGMWQVRVLGLSGELEYEIVFAGKDAAFGWMIAQASGQERWRIIPKSWSAARDELLRRDEPRPGGGTFDTFFRHLSHICYRATHFPHFPE